jgi:hypothetical protein
LDPPRARDGEREARGAAGKPEKHRDQFEAHRRDEVGDGQKGDPERARERLDPLPGIEDRAVTGADLLDHAQVDEPVVGDPAVRVSRRDKADDGRYVQGRLQPASGAGHSCGCLPVVHRHGCPLDRGADPQLLVPR